MDPVTISALLALSVATFLILLEQARRPDGDFIGRFGLLAVLIFMGTLLVQVLRVDQMIRDWPAPSAPLAAIVTGLAWPVIIGLILFKFAGPLGLFVAEIVRRFQAGNGFKTPWFEIGDTAQPDLSDTSRARIMALYGTQTGREKIDAWLQQNLPGVQTLEFFTDNRYVSRRNQCLDSVQ